MNLPEESQFEQPPTGTHSAICIGFYDLGTQRTEYQGEVSKKHQVFIRWELPTETMEDGRPFTIGQFYTWSMAENAKLRAHLEAWRNKPFDKADFGKGGKFNTKNLLGVPCTLVVGETEKGKAKVTSVGPKMKGIELAAAVNPPLYIALTKEDFDSSALGKLSERMQDIVKKSPEYFELMGGAKPAAEASADDGYGDMVRDTDDEIPF